MALTLWSVKNTESTVPSAESYYLTDESCTWIVGKEPHLIRGLRLPRTKLEALAVNSDAMCYKTRRDR